MLLATFIFQQTEQAKLVSAASASEHVNPGLKELFIREFVCINVHRMNE